MKRYIIFAYPDYEATGGMFDFITSVKTEKEAKDIAQYLLFDSEDGNSADSVQIYDMSTGIILEASRYGINKGKWRSSPIENVWGKDFLKNYNKKIDHQ